MTCHRCPHSREIARLREICSKCELGDKCAVSGTTSLDALSDGALETGELRAKLAAGVSTRYEFNPDTIDEPALADGAHDAQGIGDIPPDATEYLLELLRRFAAASLTDVLVLHGFLNGWGIVRMADKYGESKQCMFARVQGTIRRNPWAAEIMRIRKKRSAAEWLDDLERKGAMDENRTGAKWVKHFTRRNPAKPLPVSISPRLPDGWRYSPDEPLPDGGE